MQQKRCRFDAREKTAKKEVPQLRVCVSRHSTGGDGGIRTHVPAHHRQNDFESFSLRPLRYVSILNFNGKSREKANCEKTAR